MARRRRLLLFLACLVLVSVLAIGVTLVLPGVERWAWDAATDAVFDRSGWRVDASDPQLRIWPASFGASSLKLSSDGRVFASVGRVTAGWRWIGLFGKPRRIDRLEIRDLEIDPSMIPARKGGLPVEIDRDSHDPWHALEIAELRIEGGRIASRVIDTRVSVDEISLVGGLDDGRASLSLSAKSGELSRQERTLRFGPMTLEAVGGPEGVRVDRVVIDGDWLRIGAEVRATIDPSPEARARVRAELEIARVLGWWDPELLIDFGPRGRLDLEGHIEVSGTRGLVLDLAHIGDPLNIAGHRIDEIEIDTAGDHRVRLAGANWGRLELSLDAARNTTVVADFRHAPVGPLLKLASIQLPPEAPGPLLLSGKLDATLSIPVTAESLSSRAELRLDWPEGFIDFRGQGRGWQWQAESVDVVVPGAVMHGSGQVDESRALVGRLEFEVSNPERLASFARAWLPGAGELGIASGSATGVLEVEGPLDNPSFSADLRWADGVVQDVGPIDVAAHAEGDLLDATWWAEATATDAGSISVSGNGALRSSKYTGRWRLDVSDIGGILRMAEIQERKASGVLRGEGDFEWRSDGWIANGEISGDAVELDGWNAERLRLCFTASPAEFAVDELEIETLDGMVWGTANLETGGVDAPFDVDLSWSGLALAAVPSAIPVAREGALDGSLEITGSFGRPEGRMGVVWKHPGGTWPVDRAAFAVSLEDGLIRVASAGLETAAGAIHLRGEIPLGDVPRPDWLWPGAPGGPVEAIVQGRGLRWAPLAVALGMARPPVDPTTDLAATISWDLMKPEARFAQATFENAVFEFSGGIFRAEKAIRARFDQGVVGVDPFVLQGPRTRMKLEGGFDTVSGDIRAGAELDLSPDVAQLIPFAVQIENPLRISLSVEGPIDALTGKLEVDHTGGALMMRRPPIELRDLRLVGEISSGDFWISEGTVGLNQGTAAIGGGWNRKWGQGVVLEFDGVTFYVGGILSKWSGLLAIEPDPEALAKVSGDLVMDAGIWERPADLASTLFGTADIGPAGDDPLHGILLDVVVRGGSGVRVNNNIGSFDLRWERLDISGTAARPVVEGELKIASGGRISIAGRKVEVQRGNIRFTGDPTVDPLVEIVPMKDIAVWGELQDESSINSSALAYRGLAAGLGMALGVENATIRPLEIAAETESDTSAEFLIGQRLGNSLAFFYATNFADVRDRTTMLQLWNIPELKGLAIQGYQKTLNDESGVNAVQRWRWGGPRSDDDRPTIQKLRLEGGWPISKWRVKRSIGVRRGEPYDPFLVFVADVRLEEILAAEGYPLARVEGRVEGSEERPEMIFSCDPGPRYSVEFAGDEPGKKIRRDVIQLYMPPPLEEAAFANMRLALVRHYRSHHRPHAEISVERREDRIVVEVDEGPRLEYFGPELVGVPTAAQRLIYEMIGSPVELAAVVSDPEAARRTIGQLLAVQGYHSAEVGDIQTEPLGENEERVVVRVNTGPRELIQELRVTGDDPLGLLAEQGTPVAVGSPLDKPSINREIARLRRIYAEAGYDNPKLKGTPVKLGDGAWAVEVEIDPGVQRRAREIRISGNRFIKQRYLANGVALREGDLVRPSILDTSVAQIASYAPVDRVDLRTNPVGVDESIVDVAVVEKPRWAVEFGAGWNSDNGLELRSGLRDDNLFGRGAGAKLRVRANDTERLALFYTSLPSLPGGKVSFGSTLAYRDGDARENPDDFREERISASIEMSYRVRTDMILKPYYRITNTRGFVKDEEFLDPEIFNSDITTATLGFNLVRDRFDNPFDPRTGYGFTTDVGWSSDYFGSDFHTLRGVVSGSVALEPRRGWTWIQTLRFGTAEPLAGSALDPEVKFFAGGQGSVRGFDRDSLGPVSQITGNPTGGGAMFILNQEIRAPVQQALRIAVFADIGQLWDSWADANGELSVGAGLGIRWSTPIGLVWGDVAWPVVNPGISSKTPKFYLGIGRPF